MKKIVGGFVGLMLLSAFSVSCVDKQKPATDSSPQYELLGYVWSGGKTLPDPTMLTAVNYAFGRVNALRNGIVIENPDRLREVVGLKKQNPDLKVMLSIGGGCSEGFSDLASCDSCRAAFARDCRRVIDEFSLDGIDYDWESPAFPDGTPEDVDNFELLLKETRSAIGDDKILSVAAMAGALGMKLPDILDYIDYISAMDYDMTWTRPGSHTSMRESEIGGFDYNVERSMKTYADKGVPPEKIMLGLSFYGRGDGKYFEEWTAYRDITPREGVVFHWDSIGCVPYAVDSVGNFILGFDNEKSLEIKCDYIKDLGLRGGMIWRMEYDTDSLDLSRCVANALMTE